MLGWELSILGVALACLLILGGFGGLGSCGPTPGMLPVLIGYMLALPIGGLLTLIGLIQLAISRFRQRKDNRTTLRVTPL